MHCFDEKLQGRLKCHTVHTNACTCRLCKKKIHPNVTKTSSNVSKMLPEWLQNGAEIVPKRSWDSLGTEIGETAPTASPKRLLRTPTRFRRGYKLDPKSPKRCASPHNGPPRGSKVELKHQKKCKKNKSKNCSDVSYFA